MPFIVYEIRKDLTDNEVRIGQTANIQRRAREHFKEELQEWRGGKREKYGTMPFLVARAVARAGSRGRPTRRPKA